MNKLHNAIGTIGVFGALAMASGTVMAADNPVGFNLHIPGTTSMNTEAFDAVGDVVSFSAALDPGGTHVTVSPTGFVMTPYHTYTTEVAGFTCSLTSAQPGLPYTSSPGNTAASGNQAHACELFFLGDQAINANIVVQIN